MKKKLLRQLRRFNNRKIKYDHILDRFKNIVPGNLSSKEINRQLIALLQILQEEGHLTMPKGTDLYFLTGDLRIPKYVIVSAKEDKSRKHWKEYMWSPPLGWIAGVRNMAESTYEDFVRVDEFIRNDDSSDQLPEKERSVDLLGDEKRLGELAQRYQDRVDLYELTKSYRTYPPLVYRRYSTDSNRGIILENRDTFDSFCKVNERMTIFEIIVYGNGLAIIDHNSFKNLPDIPVKDFEYFGDLDPTGLYIGQTLAKKVPAEIDIRMEYAPFYQRLIELYENQNFIFEAQDQKQEYNLDFLPPSKQELIGEIFARQLRIPQELLNKIQLAEVFKQMA